MRDIIWTIIIVWLIYKLTEIFMNAGKKRTQSFQQQEHPNNESSHSDHKARSALKKGADKEGEYIDFEEMR